MRAVRASRCLTRPTYVHCNYSNYTRSKALVKTKIIRIGNSQGIRIPKPVLEEAGLGDEVELRITPSGLVLEPLASARSGWEAAARDLAAEELDASDVFLPTDFDETEWEW